MMRIRLSRRFYLYLAVIIIGCGVIGVGLYGAAQSLLGHVLQGQLRQAGYPHANVRHVRLYLDGIVIGQIDLDQNTHLANVFTPQSPPDIAKNGLHHVIVKQWEQTIETVQALSSVWPFPQIDDFVIETMTLHLKLPMHTVTLSGTLKSLQTEPGHLSLIVPFETEDSDYTLQGKLELSVENGKLASIDINLEDGSYQTTALGLKRLSGWFNAQIEQQQPVQIQAQFMAGSVLYNGQNFADGVVQYSQTQPDEQQWTITLNRPADHYFNTWVIKAAQDGRYAVQIATQAGKASKSSVMVSAVPLRLEPLLPAPVAQAQPSEPAQRD